MEFKTCEERILWQLDRSENRVAELAEEVGELKTNNEELCKVLAGIKSMDLELPKEAKYAIDMILEKNGFDEIVMMKGE